MKWAGRNGDFLKRDRRGRDFRANAVFFGGEDAKSQSGGLATAVATGGRHKPASKRAHLALVSEWAAAAGLVVGRGGERKRFLLEDGGAPLVHMRGKGESESLAPPRIDEGLRPRGPSNEPSLVEERGSWSGGGKLFSGMGAETSAASSTLATGDAIPAPTPRLVATPPQVSRARLAFSHGTEPFFRPPQAQVKGVMDEGPLQFCALSRVTF